MPIDSNLQSNDTEYPIESITWWLTGLSGAGKTTLAQALANDLRSQKVPVCVLDGDELRQGLSKDLGFSMNDREEQCRRVAEMAKLLNQNHILVIVALISPTAAGRNEARKIIGNTRMKEIHISTPLAICQQRDVKGLYAQALQQNGIQLTGVQSQYEIPDNPADQIDTSVLSVAEAVTRLKRFKHSQRY